MPDPIASKLSVLDDDVGPPAPEFPLLATGDLTGTANPRWLWDGYLAGKYTTLFTSQWKTGKTTLLTLLLARMEQGGTLAGRAVAPGRAVVVSEEGTEPWLQRLDLLGPAPHLRLICQPFDSRPDPAAWERLIAALLAEHAVRPLSLVVVDPLATVFPGVESSSRSVLDVLKPLVQLTKRGVAVLLMHHPRKGEWHPGQAARGSGTLTSYVDVLVEMTALGALHSSNRRRRLQAWSRLHGTPDRLLIELNKDGRDYLTYGDWQAYEFAQRWPVLQVVFQHARSRLTGREVLREWPTDRSAVPNPRTLHRWLESAVTHGCLARSGHGHSRDPYRYYLPDRQTQLKPVNDPLHDDPLIAELDALQAKAFGTRR